MNSMMMMMIMISMVMMMMMMMMTIYRATSNYALSALQLLKHELIYKLSFTHTNIHSEAIVGASTISFTPNFHAQ